MARKRFKWNSEKVLSLTAMAMSFITLIIFIQQTRIMSRQNYLSILPYLDISTTRDQEKSLFELNLKNHGVGPAIIESVVLAYKGKQFNLADYDHYMFKFLLEQIPELDSLKGISSSSLDIGMAIPANTSYNVLRVKDSPKDYELLDNVIERLLEEGFEYEIIYKSIQNERWKIYNNSEGPKPLR